MSRHNWVNDKYKTDRVIFQVEADISYRIKKHKKALISRLKKEIKDVAITTVATVKKVKG